MMRILFICGALEYGKDGVGDYTRKLAYEFIQRGHNVTALSINDKYVKDVIIDKISNDNKLLSIVRLPSKWLNAKKFTEVEHHINNIRPIWILFQYVPFSYSLSGTPFFLVGFVKKLKAITQARLFIFFHEVSIDWSFKKIKHIPIAASQNIIAKKLVSIADKTATSIDLYSERLSTSNRNVPLIPIGSNITIFKRDQNKIDLLKVQLGILHKPIIVTFGVRSHIILIEAFQKVRNSLLNVHLFILGSLKEISKVPDELYEHITVTGFLPEEEIMTYLHASDLFIQLNNDSKGGINNKSGSLAAAFAAALPIIGIKGKITNSLLTQNQPCIFIKDKSELPSAIVSFFALSASEKESFRIKSKSFYNAYLSWSRITEQYMNILNQP